MREATLAGNQEDSGASFDARRSNLRTVMVAELRFCADARPSARIAFPPVTYAGNADAV
jgi:hypothetical protein